MTGIGWLLILIGLFVTIVNVWSSSRGLGQLLTGMLLVVLASRFDWRRSLMFVAVIFIASGFVSLIWELQIIDFKSWRLGPLFFGVAGIGFLSLYALRSSNRWLLVPGGLLCVLSGAGLTARNWWHYQRWLNGMFDQLPYILIVIGVVLLIIYRWNRSE